MEHIITRKAVEKDLESLFIFEQGVISAERPFDPTLKNDPIHYYDIQKMMDAEAVELLVAELNGEPVGCGYARIENAKPYLHHSQHAYLGFMYVLPSHRGKGLKLIDALTLWCKSKNIHELRLDVYYNNDAAIRAYEKAGFTKHMIEMRKGL